MPTAPLKRVHEFQNVSIACVHRFSNSLNGFTLFLPLSWAIESALIPFIATPRPSQARRFHPQVASCATKADGPEAAAASAASVAAGRAAAGTSAWTSRQRSSASSGRPSSPSAPQVSKKSAALHQQLGLVIFRVRVWLSMAISMVGMDRKRSKPFVRGDEDPFWTIIIGGMRVNIWSLGECKCNFCAKRTQVLA